MKINKIKYQNSSKMSINKSMDSKRLLYKGNNHNNNIIHVNNNTKIIKTITAAFSNVLKFFTTA